MAVIGRRVPYRKPSRALQTVLEEDREPEPTDRGAVEESGLEACIIALETAIRGLGNQVGVGLARHLVVAVLDLTFRNEHPEPRRGS